MIEVRCARNDSGECRSIDTPVGSLGAGIRETELGYEAYRTHHAERILIEALTRIADGPDDSIFQIALSVERISKNQ